MMCSLGLRCVRLHVSRHFCCMINLLTKKRNFFQVVSNRDTQETLLCTAYVFEVATGEHGAQHHIYRLVKDQRVRRTLFVTFHFSAYTLTILVLIGYMQLRKFAMYCHFFLYVSLTWGIRIYSVSLLFFCRRKELKHSVAVYIS